MPSGHSLSQFCGSTGVILEEIFRIMPVKPWLNFRFCPCTSGWLSLGGTYQSSCWWSKPFTFVITVEGQCLVVTGFLLGWCSWLAGICWNCELKCTSWKHFERAESKVWSLNRNFTTVNRYQFATVMKAKVHTSTEITTQHIGFQAAIASFTRFLVWTGHTERF